MALMEQGIDLMVAGMVTVFTFLALLVLCTVAMSRLIGHTGTPAPPPGAGKPPAAGKVDAAKLAAATAAVERHRRTRS